MDDASPPSGSQVGTGSVPGPGSSRLADLTELRRQEALRRAGRPLDALDGRVLEGGAPDGAEPQDEPDAAARSLRRRLATLAAGTDGSGDTPASLEEVDRLAAFQPAILAIRWGTTAVSVALAAPFFAVPDLGVVVWCGLVVLHTLFRTFTPLRYLGDRRSLMAVLAEVMFHLVAVDATGYWDSPLVFSLLTAITVAGFARGFGFALRIGVGSVLAVSVPFLVNEGTAGDTARTTAEWTASLLLVALVAGYARRISGEADRQHSLALDRLGRLADANALLFSLHRVTQTLPASLDLDEVLDTTVGRLRNLFDVDSLAVFVLDETDTGWQVIRREGVRLPSRVDRIDLPPPLQRAAGEQAVITVDDLEGEEGPGLSGRSGSGMYAVLEARGSVIGLLAVEARARAHYRRRDLELFGGLVEPVALAIDNARWFARLRTVGADEERTRIARDLHDRIGQSLAYLAFELDRIVDHNEDGTDIALALEQLRGDVRGVIGEVRDTLYDLRTDVTDDQGMADVLENFVGRVRERSGIDIELTCDRFARLPILQEREMWRIAQEAITNVERHSGATHAEVRWRCTGPSATLDVVDDGVGLPTGTSGRLDSYGLLGMRERASSIGATLEILPGPSGGTRVRCVLMSTAE